MASDVTVPFLRTYTSAALREVAFPLGGIGTGTVSLGGRGELRDWEIFNRPAKGRSLPFTFFALWARQEGSAPITRVLERRLLPPFVDGAGIPPGQVAGLPRLHEATFTGTYPFASIAFEDGSLPVQVELEAFNPFVPLDAEASGLPIAVFRWRLRNPGPRPVDATLVYSQLNPVGYDGVEPLRRGRLGRLFGGNRNEWRDQQELRGLYMDRDGQAVRDGDPGAGSLSVVTSWPSVTYALKWERSGWFDDLQSFWDRLRASGRLPDDATSTPTPSGQTDVGSLGLMVHLEPGTAAELPILLTWHFPNLTNYWNAQPEVAGKRLGNYYTTRFADAWDTARWTVLHLDDLEARSRTYRDMLFASTLPAEALDAIASQVSIIRTTTCLRTSDGRFHAFEGCNDNAGCCPMDCTHVWNYEQALAHLFPDLERSMRLTDFAINTLPDGEQKFRTLLPVASGAFWQHGPAADGQVGSILKLYREWQLSGDEGFLRALWPKAKQALEFAWRAWDPDRDGVMDGEQHNTYDVEFYGPNSMCGTLYLGALLAASRMASALGDGAAAQVYEQVFASGRVRMDQALWNGEYYEQHVPGWEQLDDVAPPVEPRYQYGAGCLSDQLLGQWFAQVVDLGELLPAAHVRTALRAIFQHNWRANLADHESCQRTYALNDEAGLLACTWPRGGRPRYPFPYADEVWTGMEYQVAAHLIYEGFVDEGIAIVRGVRQRHDGLRRNPWDEFECGHHYARALSSWSLLLALSGFRYSAPRQELGFAPRVAAEHFRCFFSTGNCWGMYGQEQTADGQRATVIVHEGTLALRRLHLPGPSAILSITAIASCGTTAVPVRSAHSGGQVSLAFDNELQVDAGQTLTVDLRW